MAMGRTTCGGGVSSSRFANEAVDEDEVPTEHGEGSRGRRGLVKLARASLEIGGRGGELRLPATGGGGDDLRREDRGGGDFLELAEVAGRVEEGILLGGQDAGGSGADGGEGLAELLTLLGDGLGAFLWSRAGVESGGVWWGGVDQR